MSFAILTIYKIRKHDKNILESIQIEYKINIPSIRRNRSGRARVKKQLTKKDKSFKINLDFRIIIKLILIQI